MAAKTAKEIEQEVLDHLREIREYPTEFVEDELPRSDMGVTDYE